ncbi:MAG: hypothetical protein KKC76_06880 [Proteobacteria bacterium]|nr:hypothetical protein [Pseudomonadota bacterium]MBU4297108.1 hypothetical protein [Pseudomonadota bacterium]MCG2746530.1 hypothetical protein [Desulfobulbaceae bacterium]
MLSNREGVETELLRGCYERLRKDAASGIDGVTKEEYGRNLETNLAVLVERLHRMSYIPQPVRRVYITKPGSTKQRPMGIQALEDKLVQAGTILRKLTLSRHKKRGVRNSKLQEFP